MGRARARFNQKARQSSHTQSTAKQHPRPRDDVSKEKSVKGPSQVAPLSTAIVIEQEAQEYQGSQDTNPLYIVPGSTPQLNLNALPFKPDGKINAKKKKRLDKFIEKQIKKEERVRILKKLEENKFDAPQVLYSTKNLGRVGLTMKEQLKRELLEEKRGLVPTITNSRLFVEQAEESEQEDPSDQESVENVQVNSPIEKPSLIAQAFGSALKSKPTAAPIVMVNDGNTTEKQEAVTSSNAIINQPLPTFGGALKRKSTTPDAKSGVKKSKESEQPSHQVYQSSDDENDTKSNRKPSVTAMKKTWKSNVVQGETIENNVEIIPCNVMPKSVPAPKPKPVAAPASNRPAFHVPVHRPEHIRVQRINLPVVAEEQPIMEAVFENDVVLLCGETGSGKTTQVPQFLYEAGFGDPKHPLYPGMIGITQPRRVAAVSMAKRVAEEMGLQDGQVAHQVRYDATSIKPQTRIKFMTDGILLREISASLEDETAVKQQPGLLLPQYSCIIIDEAHERTVGTDVLIGWLTRIANVRNQQKIKGLKPLKLIIMSATLRVEDFTNNQVLFPSPQKPPVLKVDGRQHKVVVHYNKRTPGMDYVSEAFKKVAKIHTKLPPGGILVFLTGQQEIQILVKKLMKSFKNTTLPEENLQQETIKESEWDMLENDQADMLDSPDLDSDLDDYDDEASDDEEEEVHVLNGTIDDEDDEDLEQEMADKPDLLLHVLPLYSLLSTKAQMQVFEPPPPGSRLCVVATNVAETSLTIPGIRYVVDCGKAKEKVYDSFKSVESFRIGWTSKAGADQRAGRAGRMGPGHCYRLYSSAVFNDYFPLFQTPEIMRVPIEGVVLQMRSLGIHHILNFPFPTPPEQSRLIQAEKLLLYLGAITKQGKETRLTSHGQLMSKFPLHPRFSKMILLAAQQSSNPRILPYVIAMVSGLSVGDPFIREDIVEQEAEEEIGKEEKEAKRKKRSAYYQAMQLFSGDFPTSDAIRMLNAMGAYFLEYSKSIEKAEVFCKDYFIRSKAMEEARKLRSQLTRIVKTVLPESLYPSVMSLSLDPHLKPPTETDLILIRQILLSGYSDHVCRLDTDIRQRLPQYAHKNAFPVYQSMWSEAQDVLQIHPSSCLFRERPAPLWIIFEELIGKEERMSADNQDIMDSRGKTLLGQSLIATTTSKEPRKYWLKGITAISEKWLFTLGSGCFVHPSQVLEQPMPKYDATLDIVTGCMLPHYGPRLWDLPATQTELQGDAAVMWFCKCLLQGEISFHANKTFIFNLLVPCLKSKPIVVTKPYSKTQSHVMTLLNTCKQVGINSKEALLRVWKESPHALLTEYKSWVPQEYHSVLDKYWPFGKVINENKFQIDKQAIVELEKVVKKHSSSYKRN